MKRIVICADGTWNEPDHLDPETGTRRPTNVTKTARAVLSNDGQGVSQIVYYHTGVGTGGPLDELTGGAFGHGMARNICDMYRFIVQNHEPEDELYFFGFSRGAYTVRSLAGFIDYAGLLHKGDDYYLPDLYRAYASGLPPDPLNPHWHKLFVEPKRFGDQLRPRLGAMRHPPIHFVGVWDTVGALGAPGLLGRLAGSAQRYGYHRVGLNPSVRNAAHALALDEQRKPFLPTLFQRGDWNGTLNQAWFAGVHSDVGGSYNYDDLANHALHWMLDLAGGLGLALDRHYLAHYRSRIDVPLHDSLAWHYRWLLGGAVQREVGRTEGAEEVLHPSVLARLEAVPGYGSDALRRWLASQESSAG